MQEQVNGSDAAAAGVVMRPGMVDAFPAPAMIIDVQCIGADGVEKWREVSHNVVCTAGKTDLVDKYLKGSAYTATWYCILAGAGTKAAGDTLASHAGWTESTPYSGNRPTITWGSTSSGSNTSSAVSISINATATVAGAGCCTVNTGTSGVLYNVSDFGASRSVVSGDTLNVTFTLSVT